MIPSATLHERVQVAAEPAAERLDAAGCMGELLSAVVGRIPGAGPG